MCHVLRDVCGSLFVVRCVVFVVCCLLCVICFLPFVRRCVRCVVCCVLLGVRRVLSAGRCLLPAA